jgi:1-aminocyclopropane-1-carboxylate deaminase
MLDVLRLDGIHPVISGNKWFKLKKYLEDAKLQGKKFILSFGGAYSNHILATAAAARIMGFESIGIIRGEKPPSLSDTLQDAMSEGMKLYFISREDYRKKNIPDEVSKYYPQDDIYIIPEGGYGLKGAEGAEEILELSRQKNYDFIIAGVGTGTMLAGLIRASSPNQEIIGIPVLKNGQSLRTSIDPLIEAKDQERYQLFDQFHFGGYAKYSTELILFMNNWYHLTGIPTDFVYTGKVFYAADQLMKTGFFPSSSKTLLIHSGGLQGNRSLPKGTLIF